jgi:hypothetical protein
VTRAYEEGEEQLLEEDAESRFLSHGDLATETNQQPTTSACSSSMRSCNSSLGH